MRWGRNPITSTLIHAEVRALVTPNLSLIISFRGLETYFLILDMPSSDSTTQNKKRKNPLRFLLPSIFKMCISKPTPKPNSVVKSPPRPKYSRRALYPRRSVSKESPLPTITEGRQCGINPSPLVTNLTRAGTFSCNNQQQCHSPVCGIPARHMKADVSTLRRRSAPCASHSRRSNNKEELTGPSGSTHHECENGVRNDPKKPNGVSKQSSSTHHRAGVLFYWPGGISNCSAEFRLRKQLFVLSTFVTCAVKSNYISKFVFLVWGGGEVLGCPKIDVLKLSAE